MVWLDTTDKDSVNPDTRPSVYVTPVTAESIARAKASAQRERAEHDRLVAQLREQSKEDLVRLCDIWSVDVVERWVQHIKSSLQVQP
jgi:cytidylate kinase